MATPVGPIVYERAGFPVELVDERDWRREIRLQRLRRTSEVTVYRAGEPPRRQLADTVPELETLFDELDPQAAPAPEPPPAPPPVWDVDANEPADERSWDDADDVIGDPQYDLVPTAAPRPSTNASMGMLLLLCIPVVLFIALAIGSGSGDSRSTAAAARTWSVSERANVRDAPSVRGTRIVATLRPGESIDGAVVADARGEDWVRIGSGPHEGLYVWTGNLAPASDTGIFNAR